MKPEPLDPSDKLIYAALGSMSKATQELCKPRNDEKIILELLDNLSKENLDLRTFLDKIIFLALNSPKQELHEAILDYRLKYPPLIESDDEHIKDES